MRLSSSVPLAVLSGLAALAPSPTLAQIQLPGIYVESPTISARPVRPAAAAPAAAESAQTEPPEAVGGIPLDRVGSAVTVVTGKDLERQQIRNAHDALRSLPGVSVSQSGGPGNITSVRLRGAESRHTLVVIDGVEVNSAADGAFDFSNLSAADIERIEVLRGPQSALYGSGAVGGVVSISTKSGRGPLSLAITNEVGTQNSFGTTARLSGGTDTAWGSLIVQRRDTDGFNVSVAGDEADGSRVSSFTFRGGLALSPNFKVEATLREHNTRAEFDDGSKGKLKGFSVPSDEPSVGDARLRVGSLQATLETFDRSWIHKFHLNGTETVREDSTSFGFSELTSTNQKIGYTSTLRLGHPTSPIQHFLTGLIERRIETFEQPTSNVAKLEMERNSIAGEIRGEYFTNLSVTASLRHDGNDFFQDFTTWNVNASFKIPGTVFRLHSGVGTGVKYPGFADLFGTFSSFVPNPGLVPEESFGYDFGVEATLLGGRAILDVTYFRANLTNEIRLEPTGVGFDFKPINLPGESRRDGVEFAARYRLIDDLTLGAAYTFLIAEESDGLQDVRRPRHSGRLDANYVFANGRGNANVAAIYNGSIRDFAFFPFPPGGSTRIALDDYWLINVAASYKLQPGVEVFGRVENLLDQDYQEVFGFNATPGIAAFAGVKLTFGGPEGVGGSWAK
jgi:vitamin B12 transporter